MSEAIYDTKIGYYCEICNKFVPYEQSYGTNRFCSPNCARKYANKFTLTEEIKKRKSQALKQSSKQFRSNSGVINLSKTDIEKLQEKFTLNDIIVHLGLKDRNLFLKFARRLNIKDNSIFVNSKQWKVIEVCRYFLNKSINDGSITLTDLDYVQKECTKLIHNGVTSKQLCLDYLGMSKCSTSFICGRLHLKLLPMSEAIIQACRNAGCYENLSEKDRYYSECKFTFSNKLLPYVKGNQYAEEFINQQFNPHLNCITKDHRISRSYGFKHHIDPYLISHPANCELMPRNSNSAKNFRCSITVEQLIEDVEWWNENIIHKIFNDFK